MFFADIYSTFNSTRDGIPLLICASMWIYVYNLVKGYDFWSSEKNVVKLEDILVPNKRPLQSKYSSRGSFTTWAGGKGPAGNAAKGRKQPTA